MLIKMLCSQVIWNQSHPRTEARRRDSRILNVSFTFEFRNGAIIVFARHTLGLVEDYGFTPSQIVLELTERGAIEDYGRFARLLHHYRSQGFRVAVDDAGTGYNSLQTLVCLQPEFLKLDRFLVRGIADNAAARRMASLLLEYARESGTRVIREGIETAEEFACLRDMGVELGQGYAIGRPAPRAIRGRVPVPEAERGLA